MEVEPHAVIGAHGDVSDREGGARPVVALPSAIHHRVK